MTTAAVVVAMVVIGMTPTGTVVTTGVTIVAMTVAMTAAIVMNAPTIEVTTEATVTTGLMTAETGMMDMVVWIDTVAEMIVTAMDPAVMSAAAVGTIATGMIVPLTARGADLATPLLPRLAMAIQLPAAMHGTTRLTVLPA